MHSVTQKMTKATANISTKDALKTEETPLSSDCPSSAQRNREIAPFIAMVMNEKEAMILATIENRPKSKTPRLFKIRRDVYRFKIKESTVRT